MRVARNVELSSKFTRNVLRKGEGWRLGNNKTVLCLWMVVTWLQLADIGSDKKLYVLVVTACRMQIYLIS